LALRGLGRFLADHSTAASMLDRLTRHGTGVATTGDTYRLRKVRQRGTRLRTPT